MGDISEIRGLVVVLTFISTLAILIGMIPVEFTSPATTTRSVSAPSFYDPSDSLYYVNGTNHKLNQSDPHGDWIWFGEVYSIDDTIGGHEIAFLENPHASPKTLTAQAYDYWWFIKDGSHRMNWYNDDGDLLGDMMDEDILDAQYTAGHSMGFKITDDTTYHFSFRLTFSWNHTAYSTPYEAWEAKELYIFSAISFDQVNTSINAFSLISSILFFQMPSVHPLVNALIAIPLWIGITYISFILILRVIGAVFGGGGA